MLIKKVIKILFYIIIGIAIILSAAMAIIMHPNIQAAIGKKVADKLSYILSVKVEIGGIYIHPISGVVLRKVYMEDSCGNVLIQANRLSASINVIRLQKKIISFNSVKAEDAKVNLVKYKGDKKLNITRVFGKFSSGKPKTGPPKKFGIGDLKIMVRRLELENSHFMLQDQNKAGQRDKGMDYAFIKIDGINLEAFSYVFTGDSMNFRIKELQAEERSGLKFDHLEGKFTVSSKHLMIDDFKFRTPNSDVDMKLAFKYNDFEDYNYFVERMYMQTEFYDSKLNFMDFSPFAPTLEGMNQEIVVSGKVYGRVSDMKGENLTVRTGKKTVYKGNLQMTGMPNIKETFIRLQAKKLYTDIQDISNFKLPGNVLLKDKFSIPKQLNELGFVDITGEFVGFYNDFVANARFATGLGVMITDLKLTALPEGQYEYRGTLATDNFNLGQILGVPDLLGMLSMSGDVEGRGLSLDSARVNVNLLVQKIEFNHYAYKNLTVRGELSNKQFQGYANIDDPNLYLGFDGLIDLNSEIPEFNFTAEVSHAHLQNLGLIERNDSLCELNFKLRANFLGSQLENMQGAVDLTEVKYTDKGKDYLANRIFLNTLLSPSGERTLSLLSPFFDANVKGKIQFAQLGYSFTLFFNNYLNSFHQNGQLLADTSGQNFVYDVKIKRLNELTSLFLPWLKVSNDSRIKGEFDTKDGILGLDAQTDTLSVYGIVMNAFTLHAQSFREAITIETNIRKVNFFEMQQDSGFSIGIEKFSLTSNVAYDSIHYKINWGLPDDSTSYGNLNGYLSFSQYPDIIIQFVESSFTYDKQTYSIEPDNEIMIGNQAVAIRRLKIAGKDESLLIEGAYSPDPTQRLTANFKNFNLSHADIFLNSYGIQIGGLLSGFVHLQNENNKPLVQAEVGIENLAVNRQDMGFMEISSQWNSQAKALSIKAKSTVTSEQIQNHPIDLSGYYYPSDTNQNFDIVLKTENFNLKPLQPFLKMAIAELDGFLSSEIQLKGSTKNPQIQGKLKFIRTRIRPKFFSTSYSFSDEIKIEPSKIIFDQMKINDSLGNIAICDGNITHKNFKDMHLNLRLNLQNFILFNAEPQQIKYVNGIAFISGQIRAFGPVNNITIEANATTERGSNIYVPLSSTVDVRTSDFVYFKEPQDTLQIKKVERTNLNVTGFNISSVFSLTPQAKIRVSLPQDAGTIEGSGEGVMTVEVNSQGDLNITGQYEIQSGSFLFNLQNILSRMLEIEKGSNIRFSGDPLNAEIDLKASFTTRTTLSGLGLDLDSTITSARIPVKTIIRLQNKLLNPQITFSVQFPKIDPDIERAIYTKLDTTDQMLMTQQFVSLLVLNNFSFAVSNRSVGNSIGISSFQMLSNQVTNLLSQISQDFDIGINYRPGDAISPQELELMLSTQLFDQRVTIDGNLGVMGTQSANQTSNVVGDINVEVMLTRDGKLRLRAFNRSNTSELLTVSAPYTQGVGLFYRKDFNNLAELFRKKRKEVQKEDASNNSSASN